MHILRFKFLTTQCCVSLKRLSYFSGSTGCSLYLLTPTQPLILSGTSELTLAPYNTCYPQLKAHMDRAGLGLTPNYWDQPLSVGKFQYSTSLLD